MTYIVAGAPWDSTFAAAVVAGVIGLLTLAGTFVQLIVTRSRLSRFERTLLADQKEVAVRQQHRLELNDGIRYVLGKGMRSREIGFTMLGDLMGASWATDDDRLKVAAVLSAIARV
ncbi:MAG: hypothetical protein JWN36_2691 [Microbacteriaceae bacterium]|nr:hypothetical protein [Microbacteriaceae bacterium]